MMWRAPAHWKTYQNDSGIRAVHAPEFPLAAIEYLAHISVRPAGQTQLTGWHHELVKDSKSAVYRITDGEAAYFAKHYTNRAMTEIIKALLRPPIRSVAIAHALLADHIPVPEPVAAVSIRRGIGKTERIFVSREVWGKPLRRAINAGALTREQRTQIAKAMGYVWGSMLSCGYLHMDPISGNFIYDVSTDTQPITLIDLDNIYRVPRVMLTSRLPFGRRRLVKFIYRLSKPLAQQGAPPIRLDEFRCFRRAYIAAGGPEIPNARVWWQGIMHIVGVRWKRNLGRSYPQL